MSNTDLGVLVQTTDNDKKLLKVPAWGATEMVKAGTARYAQIRFTGAGPSLAEVELNPDFVVINVARALPD